MRNTENILKTRKKSSKISTSLSPTENSQSSSKKKNPTFRFLEFVNQIEEERTTDLILKMVFILIFFIFVNLKK